MTYVLPNAEVEKECQSHHQHLNIGDEKSTWQSKAQQRDKTTRELKTGADSEHLLRELVVEQELLAEDIYR
jgi:hypothetical protein